MGRVRNSNQIPHRAGPLVQANKKHKAGKHRTKGAIDKETKGRTNEIKSSGRPGKQHVKRAERKKQLLADRNHKIREIITKKRAQGGLRGAPISVALIPLSRSANPALTLDHIVKQSEKCATLLGKTQTAAHLKLNSTGGKTISFFLSPEDNVWSVLDTIKLCDVVLFVLPILEPLSDVAHSLLEIIKGQGITTQFLAVSVDLNKSEEKQYLKAAGKILQVERIFPIVNAGQIGNLLRMISSSKISSSKQFELRSGMTIESWNTVQVTTSFVEKELPHFSAPSDGLVEAHILQVTGCIRKRNLNPQRPVHIAGHGTFRILRVDIEPIQDPKLISRKHDIQETVSIPEELKLDYSLPPRFLFNPVDVPVLDVQIHGQEDDCMSVGTMEDIDDGDEFSENDEEVDKDEPQPRRRKKSSAQDGASDYQADWLIDTSDSGSEAGDMESVESETGSEEENEDEMDWNEEEKQLQLAKAARTEAEFPDWVDTPQDTLAKVRFQRYRGLESFKTSKWDVHENLPKEYSRIFQFQNYRHTYKSVVVKDTEDGPLFIPVGQRVRLLLGELREGSNGSSISEFRISDKTKNSPPVALISLFPHETKMCVVNIHLNVSGVIKNKEKLIFQMGFYRFQAEPILSQLSEGNKHKMLRYAQENESCMATIYAPILFPTASVLVFKASDTSLVPVATGNLFSLNPNRLIIKRILLSGYPFRVHGRKATVRFMFFHREDIDWFKPVELRTRYGRRGHIREKLGTHGHMKCVFDGPLKSQDTVLMPLYKRVFPKWTYDPDILRFQLFNSLQWNSV